jgi:hypothetical protein
MTCTFCGRRVSGWSKTNRQSWAWSLIRNEKPTALNEKTVTDKSKDIATCKEMPVVPVNLVLDN